MICWEVNGLVSLADFFHLPDPVYYSRLRLLSETSQPFPRQCCSVSRSETAGWRISNTKYSKLIFHVLLLHQELRKSAVRLDQKVDGRRWHRPLRTSSAVWRSNTCELGVGYWLAHKDDKNRPSLSLLLEAQSCSSLQSNCGLERSCSSWALTLKYYVIDIPDISLCRFFCSSHL